MKKSLATLLRKLLLVSLICCITAPVALAQNRIVADAQGGIWRYEDETLKVSIQRREDESIPLIWYEAELICSAEQPLIAMVLNETRPGTTFKSPQTISRENKYVLALSDDHFGIRMYNKRTVGVVIRNGTIISDKTNRKSAVILPNLDTMAFFADGRAEVNACAELTAQEFIDKGAVNVLSFGPVLIRDGEINEILYGNFKHTEPRVGFGMIAPYHYMAVVVEGRHSKSKGADLSWLAEKLFELGAQQALNLDGGQTSALVFMGEKLNKTGSSGSGKNVRNVAGLLAVGYSELVPDAK